MPLSGQTRLQITNRVLTRLREETVATTSSTLYAALVAATVDVVKTEIENAHRWLDMRDTYIVTATPGTSSYVLTGSGAYAQVLDAWNVTEQIEMKLGTFRDFNNKFFGTTSVQTGTPTMYLPAGLDASYDKQIDIWPVPTSTVTLKFNVYAPQAALSTDSMVPLVPNDVLVEGTISRMLAERGDDNGTQVQMQEGLYQKLLGDAIAIELGADPSEVDWIAD